MSLPRRLLEIVIVIIIIISKARLVEKPLSSALKRRGIDGGGGTGGGGSEATEKAYATPQQHVEPAGAAGAGSADAQLRASLNAHVAAMLRDAVVERRPGGPPTAPDAAVPESEFVVVAPASSEAQHQWSTPRPAATAARRCKPPRERPSKKK